MESPHAIALMLVKRFRGRCVKRMRRVPNGIRLTFLSKRHGERGEQLTVTQVDWERFGTQHFQENLSLSQLRQQESQLFHLPVALY